MRHIVFGRSVRGASHIRAGIECQDNYRKVILDDGTIILAVADGHGSSGCPFSRAGSRIAVNAFCDILKEVYENYAGRPDRLASFLNREGDTRISRAIDAEWKMRVVMLHRRAGREIDMLPDGGEDLASVYRLYGSTLIGILIASGFVFGFQLGDGDICFVDDLGLVKLIEPEKLLGTETYSLSCENSWQKAVTVVRRLEVKEDMPAMFSLSTDGYANSYESEGEFQAAIREYLDMLKEHGGKAVFDNLSDWLWEVSDKGSGDDITMLIAYFVSEGHAAAWHANDPPGGPEKAVAGEADGGSPVEKTIE